MSSLLALELWSWFSSLSPTSISMWTDALHSYFCLDTRFWVYHNFFLRTMNAVRKYVLSTTSDGTGSNLRSLGSFLLSCCSDIQSCVHYWRVPPLFTVRITMFINLAFGWKYFHVIFWFYYRPNNLLHNIPQTEQLYEISVWNNTELQGENILNGVRVSRLINLLCKTSLKLFPGLTSVVIPFFSYVWLLFLREIIKFY